MSYELLNLLPPRHMLGLQISAIISVLGGPGDCTHGFAHAKASALPTELHTQLGLLPSYLPLGLHLL